MTMVACKCPAFEITEGELIKTPDMPTPEVVRRVAISEPSLGGTRMVSVTFTTGKAIQLYDHEEVEVHVE